MKDWVKKLLNVIGTILGGAAVLFITLALFYLIVAFERIKW